MSEPRQHAPNCAREILRHADDSAAYLHERCTCKIEDAMSEPRAPEPRQEACLWEQSRDPDCDYWETTCGQTWQFLDGGPAENRTRFCHYCGGPIEFRYAPTNEDAEETADV